MNLYGQKMTAPEVRQRVGCMDQVAGIRLATLQSGRAQGLRAALVHTGSGLDFTVLLDRGMDIGAATWQGAALGWRGSVGDVAPAFFEPEHLRWLRSFQGGLVATCGLSNVGGPQEGSESTGLGLHGRIGAIPADDVCVSQEWEGDNYVLRVSGVMRETSVFGEKFRLKRTITAWAGESRIALHDELTNESFAPQPFQLLYHCNIGWPVVREGARVLAPSRCIAPRDATAAAGIAAWNELSDPVAGYAEQVFYHDLVAGPDGMVTCAIVNGDFSQPEALGVYVRYSADTLPRFAQWKMMGQQEYVVGLEPANCGVQGRAHDEAEGLLEQMEPWGKRDYRLEFGVIGTAADYQQVQERIGTAEPKVCESYRDFTKQAR